MGGPNHPFVVWASHILWITSVISVTFSLLLFCYVGDFLIITRTDLVNAVVLLSGIVMIPTNCHMLYAISNGKKIDSKSKVLCCPLWMCILWIVAINILGVALAILRLYQNSQITSLLLANSLKNYRSVPRYKHFIDNLQWSLKCCGINSYMDWFKHDWCEQPRDYEWLPLSGNHQISKEQAPVSDSVPLSCCKSGSCISNFLMELGTQGINTKGCSKKTYNLVMASMYINLVVFISVIVTELLILKFISKTTKTSKEHKQNLNVRHLMTINSNFDLSSISSSLEVEDSKNFVIKAVRND